MATRLFVAFFCCLAIPGFQQNDLSKKDLTKLQGTWKMVELEVNGEEVPASKFEKTTLLIKDDKYIVKAGKRTFTTAIKLDASKSPKEIDMTFLDDANKGLTGHGIYKVDEDTFTLVRSQLPGQDRPTDFRTGRNTNIFRVMWKRQMP